MNFFSSDHVLQNMMCDVKCISVHNSPSQLCVGECVICVCVSVYVFVCECVCVFMFLCMCVFVYMWVYVRKIYLPLCVSVCLLGGWVGGCMYVCMHVCMYVHLCACSVCDVYGRLCMCVCVILQHQPNPKLTLPALLSCSGGNFSDDRVL